MSVFTIPNVFVSNTKIKSASVNANFTAIASTLNTNLLPAVGNTKALVTTDAGGNLQSVLPIGTEGQTLVVDPTATTTGGLSWSTPSSGTAAGTLFNAGVANVANAGALTVSVKQSDGVTNPTSGTGAVQIGLRNPNQTIGGYNIRSVSGILSMSLSLGTTLGLSPAQNNNLWIYAIDSDGVGTIQLAVSTVRQDEGALQNVVPESSPVTVTIASPAIVTLNNHGLVQGDKITLSTTGALPTGLVAGTVYYVGFIDSNTFNLSSTPAPGSLITTTGSQSGIHTLHIAGGNLVSNSTYSNCPVKLLARGIYNLTTPGTWMIAQSLALSPTIQGTESIVAYYTNVAGSLASSLQNIAYPDIVRDTHGSYDPVQGFFSVLQTGYYDISAQVDINATFTTGQFVTIAILVNGVLIQEKYEIAFTGQTEEIVLISIEGYPLNHGDYVTIQAACTGASPSFNIADITNFMSVIKVA